MSEKRLALGFGFIPAESRHHFLVCIPDKKDANVVIYERFSWQDDESQQVINTYEDKPKAETSKHKWKLLEETLRKEFNNRLKKQKIPVGRFMIGQTPVERLLGKEMLLLVWAVEDSDPSVIPTAIRNWLGLAPEERWWLFTMTNAATGGINDRRGWRKALRYALTENPIDEHRQQSLFDIMINKGMED
ncbi:DUF3780 domain-containing protein [Bacteroides sp.]|uniref:DUF3780 domain-containing protein n=1 Tax=Bacteroides sp. TaxID=29523 RepID=UPI00261FD486|nr:DUF3780 domain-containing protein [Bacteroides sp.]MDD3040646.1 DUF3780 domain-containing protein [Bacteroides sp.]